MIKKGTFMLNTRTVLVSSVVAAALALAACSPAQQNDSAEKVDTASSAAATAGADKSAEAGSEEHAMGDIHMRDGVVREMAADSDMTAIFGEIHNGSDKDIHVTGFTTSINAKMNQIHEVVDGVMQEDTDGLMIPAGESVTLAPGGQHLMLMGVAEPVMAGEEVDVTLELEDGTTVDLGAQPVRSMNAGEEGYQDLEGGMAGMSEMPGMADMSEHDHAH